MVRIFRLVTEKTVEERIVERAEQKLRLDALVIQSGRLAEKQKNLGKDEMLSMIQFGASEMFQKTNATITDEDIDAILERGEAKTADGLKKLASLGDIESLQSFTFDTKPKQSLHEFEGEDFSKKSISETWIAPAKRERKTDSYNISNYYNSLRPEQVAKPRQPKPPKLAKIEQHQFYPLRLVELQKQEIASYRNQIGYKIPALEGEHSTPEKEAQRKADQAAINGALPLTEEETAERDTLLEQGFSEWSKKDFLHFTKACERFGRDDIGMIKNEVESKTPEEVVAYHAVFAERFKELDTHVQIMTAIKRGEEKIKKREEIQKYLDLKMAKYLKPFQHLRIQYGSSKGKNFTEEEDRYLICTLHQLGYDNDTCFERLRREVRNSPAFRFDWFIKSRTSTELQRRCSTLIGLIEKEIDEEKAKKPKGKGGGAAVKKRKEAPGSADRATKKKR